MSGQVLGTLTLQASNLYDPIIQDGEVEISKTEMKWNEKPHLL